MFRLYLLPDSDQHNFKGLLVDTSDNEHLRIDLVSGSVSIYNEHIISQTSPVECVHPHDKDLAPNFAERVDHSDVYITRIANIALNDYSDAVLTIPFDSMSGMFIALPLDRDKANLHKPQEYHHLKFAGSYPQHPLKISPNVSDQGVPVEDSALVTAPQYSLEHFKLVIDELISQLDSLFVWNGRDKAAKLRTAYAGVNDDMTVDQAFNCVKAEAKEHRLFRDHQDKLPFFFVTKPRGEADSINKIYEKFPALKK